MLKKPFRVRKVYLDNSAATPMATEVFQAMRPYFGEKFGNPSALYGVGRDARAAVENARKTIAEILSANSENIIFTAGGTEADNLALFGLAKNNEYYGRHLVVASGEHHAILKPVEDLVKAGWEVTYVKTDKFGRVDPEEVIAAICPDTVCVTVMYANNETGAVQPIADIGREILKYRKKNNSEFPYFHTDACQAAGYLDLDVSKLHVDLMTINGGKIYGPKGAGLLFVKNGIKLKPLILGGEQEGNRRAGTENVPGIIGLAEAMSLTQKIQAKENKRLSKLTEYFWNELLKKIPDIQLNGPEEFSHRLPHILNVSFRRVEGEALLLYLDEFGISCSTGSACTSTTLSPSHVLKAMGISDEIAHGSLRFSLGRSTTKADIDYVMAHLPRVVKFLRELSPIK